MYKEIEPIIDNTICEAREENEKVISYRIRPAEGYKLHEVTLDKKIIDEETGNETGKVKVGYTKSYITLGVLYDWDKNTRNIYIKSDLEEDEIIDINSNNISSTILEKAEAYDILIGVEK